MIHFYWVLVNETEDKKPTKFAFWEREKEELALQEVLEKCPTARWRFLARSSELQCFCHFLSSGSSKMTCWLRSIWCKTLCPPEFVPLNWYGWKVYVNCGLPPLISCWRVNWHIALLINRNDSIKPWSASVVEETVYYVPQEHKLDAGRCGGIEWAASQRLSRRCSILGRINSGWGF